MNALYTYNRYRAGLAENSFPPGNRYAGMGALSLGINKNNFIVGEVPTYVILGAAANSPVLWSSTRNGLPTGENQSNYGQTTDANGNLTGNGSPWAAEQVGTWTKTATVGAENFTVSFTVLPLGASTTTGSGNWIPYYGPTSAHAVAPAAPADNINIFGYDVPRIPFYIAVAFVGYSLVKKK